MSILLLFRSNVSIGPPTFMFTLETVSLSMISDIKIFMKVEIQNNQSYQIAPTSCKGRLYDREHGSHLT